MAAPVNTLASTSTVGLREDLANFIYDISPDETPLLTALPKTKASNTLHEWQTFSLRAATDNAHIEGDDTIADAAQITARVNNRTQIFKNTAAVTGTQKALNPAGRGDEMAFQLLQATKAHKLDMERALFLNQAKVTGTDIVAPRLAGLGAWIKTNVDKAGDGTNPTGDGSNARTDGTQAAFNQTRFDNVLQQMWENGADPKVVMLSAYQNNIAQGFVGSNGQRSQIAAEKDTVRKLVEVYITAWGTVTFVPVRQSRSRDVWILDPEMAAIATARPTQTEELAKLGDSDRRQIVTEMTLVVRNEAGHGLVADCTTS